MTETHERRISHDELKLLCFVCSECQAELTLDIENSKQRERFHPNNLLIECPFCRSEFSSDFARCIRLFIQWYQSVRAINQQFMFRIPISGTGAPQP